MIVQRLDHVNIITNRLADTARFCGAARDHRVLRLGCLLVLGDDKAKTNWEDRQRRVSAIWRGYRDSIVDGVERPGDPLFCIKTVALGSEREIRL